MGEECGMLGRKEKLIQNFSWKTSMEESLEDLHINGRIISEWILKKRVRVCGFDSPGSEYGPEADSHKHGNEPSCLTKCGDFLD
jgi:hypothetical protein